MTHRDDAKGKLAEEDTGSWIYGDFYYMMAKALCIMIITSED